MNTGITRVNGGRDIIIMGALYRVWCAAVVAVLVLLAAGVR